MESGVDHIDERPRKKKTESLSKRWEDDLNELMEGEENENTQIGDMKKQHNVVL